MPAAQLSIGMIVCDYTWGCTTNVFGGCSSSVQTELDQGEYGMFLLGVCVEDH